jgi:hypothetical protein
MVLSVTPFGLHRIFEPGGSSWLCCTQASVMYWPANNMKGEIDPILGSAQMASIAVVDSRLPSEDASDATQALLGRAHLVASRLLALSRPASSLLRPAASCSALS